MSTREYARLSEIAAGDTLIADEGFTCLPPGPHVVQAHKNLLWVACEEGKHFLFAADEDDRRLVGFTRPAPLAGEPS